VIKCGKPAFKEVASLVEVYPKRLQSHFSDCRNDIVKKFEPSNSRSAKGKTLLIGLDESGEAWSTQKLAEYMKKWLDDPSIDQVDFVIGDPYGLTAETKGSCFKLWSISNCTLPSDFAWLLTWEQLFRASSILRGTSYHHGGSA